MNFQQLPNAGEPEDVLDLELIDRACARLNLTNRLLEGFKAVGLRRVELCYLGLLRFRLAAICGRDRRCLTMEGVESVVSEVAKPTGHEIDNGQIVVFVELDQFGTTFRLRPMG